MFPVMLTLSLFFFIKFVQVNFILLLKFSYKLIRNFIYLSFLFLEKNEIRLSLFKQISNRRMISYLLNKKKKDFFAQFLSVTCCLSLK